MEIGQITKIEKSSYSMEITKLENGFSLSNFSHSGVYGLDFEDNKIYQNFSSAKRAALKIIDEKITLRDNRNKL